MKLFEGKTPAERNKTIFAIAVGAVALFLLARMFFGSYSDPKGANTNANRRPPRPVDQRVVNTNNTAEEEALIPPQPIIYRRASLDASAAGRNIFAYYTPPAPPPAVSDAATTPQPTPEPPPPLVLASLSKPNVYAKTGDFTLQVTGDKFTPQTRIYVNGQELPTQFASPQQLSATVPAALIASPGAREVMVRTPDGQLFSNRATLNVTQPPGPEYTYVGIFGRTRYNDTAVLKNQKGELVSVQLGKIVDGRFRVTSISERAIEFTDQELKIKHTLPFIEGRTSTSDNMRMSPQPRYVPPVQPLQQPQPPKSDKPADDDDEDEIEP